MMWIRRFLRFFYGVGSKLLGGPTLTARRCGVEWCLDLSESFDASLFFRGDYEPETWKCLRSVLEPGMTVIDVGANMGAHTLRIARLLDPQQGGRLIACEPTTYAFERLARNAALNDLPALTLERIAFSDRVGTEEIDRGGGSEVLPFRASWRFDGRRVTQRRDVIHFERLDGYVRRAGIQRVHLIKIDVDGYEYRVLKGGRETIERDRPTMVVEVGHSAERVGDSIDAVLSLLESLRYSVEAIASDATGFDSVRQLSERLRTFDLVCTPES